MPKGEEVGLEKIEAYESLRAKGWSQGEAALSVGLSQAWASRHERSRPSRLWAGVEPSAEVLAILEDFALWRACYLGHTTKPWMVEAALVVKRLLATDSPEMLVMNMPPGAGKSTFVQDLIVWLLVQDRGLRAIFGADTKTNAEKATGLMQDYFEAQVPVLQPQRLIDAGQATVASRVLAHDFGAFRPASASDGRWTREAFDIVGKAPVKEASVTAYGYDSGVLGNRAELVCWDDLVTEKITRNETSAAKLVEEWDGGLGESRLEPFSNGLLVLFGQRIGPRDLYRHCLEQLATEWFEGKEVELPKYTHITYPAHFDHLCTAKTDPKAHDPAIARSWPHGCLLDADRLPWVGKKGLGTKKRNSPRTYEIQFQQQDGTAEGALIENEWIYGGADSEGLPRPGCLNRNRVLGQVPASWPNRLLSLATVDPSGTQYWAVQWWVVSHELNARALMRLFDRKMSADHLLDWNGDRFTGLLEELWQESVRVGQPITHVVVEINAGQRYLIQTNTARKWRELRRVVIVPHTTSRNKLDPELGLNILKEPFRSGWVDLPYGDVAARGQVDLLAKQLTNLSDRDDQKMGCWFMELWMHKLRPRRNDTPRLPRPSWLLREKGVRV